MLMELKSILDLIQKLPTERDCQNYFAFVRWNNKPKCLTAKMKKIIECLITDINVHVVKRSLQ